MRIVMFYHTLLSDWNHGNAHFLRGVATELISRGHEVDVYEPEDSWSYKNLLSEHGQTPLKKFHAAYPTLNAHRYDRANLDLEAVLDGADLVLVHEWNDHELVRAVGEHRKRDGNFHLLFHDTHHRMVTDPKSMAAYDLANYDGVLAYGRVLRDLYEMSGRVKRAWVWHEAADIRMFRPITGQENEGDLVWIGNWGDGERSSEIDEFIIQPIKALNLKARFYGVRYPEEALKILSDADIEYAGWLPNFEAPEVFARYKVTVHVPRLPYVKALPGIPTIRPFEALACGIPLVSSPWEDAEHLFDPGRDFLLVRNGKEMRRALRAVLNDKEMAREMVANGLKTIRSRHTCAHRVDELLSIAEQLQDSTRKKKEVTI
jgi:spore maturation protein CgeB